MQFLGIWQSTQVENYIVVHIRDFLKDTVVMKEGIGWGQDSPPPLDLHLNSVITIILCQVHSSQFYAGLFEETTPFRKLK